MCICRMDEAQGSSVNWSRSSYIYIHIHKETGLTWDIPKPGQAKRHQRELPPGVPATLAVSGKQQPAAVALPETGTAAQSVRVR